MEHAPKGLDMGDLEQSVKDVAGVLNVHDLHVWTVASGIVACSCHIRVADQSARAGQQVLQGVAEVLKQRFGITHSTIQVEVEGCGPDDLYCTLRPAHEGHSGHHHPH
jgi:cobalt-zinc-cadmium efflux system protein